MCGFQDHVLSGRGLALLILDGEMVGSHGHLTESAATVLGMFVLFSAKGGEK
jgi:hypothetical protein